MNVVDPKRKDNQQRVKPAPTMGQGPAKSNRAMRMVVEGRLKRETGIKRRWGEQESCASLRGAKEKARSRCWARTARKERTRQLARHPTLKRESLLYRSTIREWKAQLISNEHEKSSSFLNFLSIGRCDMSCSTRARLDGATRLFRNASTPARAASPRARWHGSDGEAKGRIEFRKGIPRFLSSSCREAHTPGGQVPSMEGVIHARGAEQSQSCQIHHSNPLPCARQSVSLFKSMHTRRECLLGP